MLNWTPDWKVLLIGGHSGTGKSRVARQLARDFAVSLVEVDDFRLVLERMTTPEQQPALHGMLADLMRKDVSAVQLRDDLIAVARTMSYALEIVIAVHVSTHAPVIVEGDGLLPALAVQTVCAGLDVTNQVRSVFLIEEDPAELFKNMSLRGRGFQTLDAEQQQRQIELSWLYGQWLQAEAQSYSLPVVSPRPWETLFERIMNKAALKS